MITTILQYAGSSLLVLGGTFHLKNTVTAVTRGVRSQVHVADSYWPKMAMHALIGLAILSGGGYWFTNIQGLKAIFA